MSANDRASVVGSPVFHEGEQIPFGTVFAYLGETDGTHYYGVQDDSGTHIYPGDDLRLMTHEGLVSFAAYREDTGQDAPAADPSAPHPFEQIGKAGDGPVSSAQLAGQTTTPVYTADDFAQYQEFLRFKAMQKDHGSTTDATVLSPAEARNADAGAIEAPASPPVGTPVSGDSRTETGPDGEPQNTPLTVDKPDVFGPETDGPGEEIPH